MAECRGLAPLARKHALVSTEAGSLVRLTLQIGRRGETCTPKAAHQGVLLSCCTYYSVGLVRYGVYPIRGHGRSGTRFSATFSSSHSLPDGCFGCGCARGSR